MVIVLKHVYISFFQWPTFSGEELIQSSSIFWSREEGRRFCRWYSKQICAGEVFGLPFSKFQDSFPFGPLASDAFPSAGVDLYTSVLDLLWLFWNIIFPCFITVNQKTFSGDELLQYSIIFINLFEQRRRLTLLCLPGSSLSSFQEFLPSGALASDDFLASGGCFMVSCVLRESEPKKISFGTFNIRSVNGLKVPS